MGRTRIVATLGPATQSESGISSLIDEGVDVFRLNFSHGTHDEHGKAVDLIRNIAGERPVAVLQDLCGPKLRLDRPVEGKPGDEVEVNLPKSVKPGDPVLLADGEMQLEVVSGNRCRVITAGSVTRGKGINLPSSRLDIPSFTDKDRKDLEFGVKKGVDMVALSFVRRAADLDEVKKTGLLVIAKIEKAEAVENIDDIIAAADGVMVARGDLGVEIPIEKVPAAQKKVIRLANLAAKPVITATQMLRSMVESRMPTRAEATDVANAVIDGTDAVMLSEETAIGNYPVESVRMMEKILIEAEPLQNHYRRLDDRDLAAVIAQAACDTAHKVEAKAIVVPTRTGSTARRVARCRPDVPIIALAPDDVVRRRLSLVWGVTAVVCDWYKDSSEVLTRFREPVRTTKRVPEGAPVVITAGWPFAESGVTNLVYVTTL